MSNDQNYKEQVARLHTLAEQKRDEQRRRQPDRGESTGTPEVSNSSQESGS